MSDVAYKAMMAARKAHDGQARKYTGEPYFNHLAEVAGISATAQPFFGPSSDEMAAVAWLHDTVEDTGMGLQTILEEFGPVVARGVELLSDMEVGTRAERKAASRKRLMYAPGWVQTIKYADLISNTGSIVRHDPKFAKVYLEEKRLLLAVMTSGDARLREIALQNAEAA